MHCACVVLVQSDAAVRRTIMSVGDFLFRHGVVTWCRIVSLFAISGAVASECATGGHPELIPAIVAMVTDVISRHAATWISQQGGWVRKLRSFRCFKSSI